MTHQFIYERLVEKTAYQQHIFLQLTNSLGTSHKVQSKGKIKKLTL